MYEHQTLKSQSEHLEMLLAGLCASRLVDLDQSARARDDLRSFGVPKSFLSGLGILGRMQPGVGIPASLEHPLKNDPT